MFGSNNQNRNKIWTEKFDEVFDKNNAEEFLNFINRKTCLKPIWGSNSDYGGKQFNNSFEISSDFDNKNFPISNISLIAENITITANKTGHIQIYNSYLKNLFIERTSLEDEYNMQKSDKDIISDGARGFDPFDQEDWVKIIGRKWPTAENTRDSNGVAILSTDNSGNAILLDTDDSIVSSYGTKPRAMAVFDKKNNSVILAFQQENQNSDIDFAAWSILPFKINEGKKNIAIFPADSKTIKNYKNIENDEFEEMRKSKQWCIEDNFFVVDVSMPSTKTEYVDSYVDWCLFAIQDEDTVCLVRSCYKDNTDDKQFKIFSGQKDLGGTKYFELEFIAPKVKKAHKSTLVYRIECLSLKNFGFDSFNSENMHSQIKEIAKIIAKNIVSSFAI